MEKLQCRHAGFPIFAAPLISDRFRELTRSDYARFDNGNSSTALPWSFSIFVPFTRRHRVPRMHTS